MKLFPQTNRDASDWLSPIVVKELRQGMRGRLFLYSFLLLQAAMILCVSGQLLSASSPQATGFEFFTGLFWFIIGVALVGVIPLAGMGALRSEIQANSIELIFLTRLTPWRIVAGKWAALTAQSLLFVCAVLPYIVLRYFLGGIDLMGELRILAWLLVTGFILTGVTVSSSAYNAWLVRGGLVLMLFVFLFGGFQMLWFFAMGGMGGMMGGGPSVNPFLVALFFVPLAILGMFEAGSAKIAPPANRHNLRIRLLGFGFLFSAVLLHFAAGAEEEILVLALIPILASCVAGLVEPPVFIRSVYAPFARFGAASRIPGYLIFYPGWPSAAGYTTVILGLFALLMVFAGMETEFLIVLWLLYGGLIVGTALYRFFVPFGERGAAWFAAIQAFMVLFAAVIISVKAVTGDSFGGILSFLPTSVMVLWMGDVISTSEAETFSAVSGITVFLSLLAIIGVAITRVFPGIRHLEEIAQDEQGQPEE